jgi:serine/threonine protein kinase
MIAVQHTLSSQPQQLMKSLDTTMPKQHDQTYKYDEEKRDVSVNCDCTAYRSLAKACPCAVEYASRTGKRAVERLLHRSEFFSAFHTSAMVEFQSEAEAAHGLCRNRDTNKIVEVEAAHLHVGELLGKGGFCLVQECTVDLSSYHQDNNNDDDEEEELEHPINGIDSNSQLCVKFLKPTILPDKRKFARGIADLAIEAHFLATLCHPNILKIRGITKGIKLFQPICPPLTNARGVEGGYFLILDRLRTTLDKKISVEWKAAFEKYNSFLYRTTHDLRGVKRKELKIERIEVALHLAQAMEYLHKHKICYRDLKPDNIGFDSNEQLKLFDFGLAKELKSYKRHEDGTYQLTANTGSRRYMAPEVALRKRYNLSVDVFSYAILLWEICSLEKPFDGFTEIQHMNLVVQNGHRPKLDILKSWPAGLKDLLHNCWKEDFNERPTFHDVVTQLGTIYDDIRQE